MGKLQLKFSVSPELGWKIMCAMSFNKSSLTRAMQRGGMGCRVYLSTGGLQGQVQPRFTVLCMPGSTMCSLYWTYKNVLKQSDLQGHTLTWELWKYMIDKLICSIMFPIRCRGIHSVGLKSFCSSNANRNTRVKTLIFDSRFYFVAV